MLFKALFNFYPLSQMFLLKNEDAMLQKLVKFLSGVQE